ncbi:phage antirepressor KilAC domain-containing protein [Crenalkalicoccus roseus]|uniref:phage antirepressor KilAC domain-containing protein n=1 Tax=Crenalkalicoccus roseus TaxID=1485588 RepID=UPI001082164B|nr:phage antirepressor [Crenalkalicoccus roseus]
MADIVPFVFEGTAVRVVQFDGEPGFVLADVCKVLGIGNSRQAATRLDDDEKGVITADTPGGAQEITVINESGLYSLILTSRKEAAKRFKKWVTAEVLPAIRRTGGYMVAAPEETPEALALRALQVLQATVERQKAQLAEAMPKVEALDRIATADGSLSITAAAKALQVRPKDLFSYLQQNGWIYKRPGSAAYLGYQSKTTAGLLEHKVTTVLRGDGSEKVVEQVLITPKGLTRLAVLLKPVGLLVA